MRTIVQRVREASVVVDAKCVAEIGQGMLLLVGFEDADTSDDLEWTAQKVANLRIFDDAEGKRVKTGIFGADMKVSLVNDGPVTIVIDTKHKE